ncbi:hypothetical protein P3738_25080, partial [Vibrio parahaemolyticus]|nr:hypothetical protein [Vibrio parahaemolyticus]NMV28701.1 hypothetical protein [Vibrio parahaemolyticus]
GVWSGRWLEYSEAIDGKRRLYWSPELKERVGLSEKTDEEIAAEQDDHAVIVYQMLDGEWRKARHNVPRVLAAAEDDENLREVIEEIEELDFYTAEPEAVETRTEGISFKVIQDIADEFREELKRA